MRRSHDSTFSACSRRAFLATGAAAVSTTSGCLYFSGADVRGGNGPIPVSASWPTFQGDASNSGRRPDVSGPSGEVGERWSTSLPGPVRGQPTVSAGATFVPWGSFPDGSRRRDGGVLAFDIETGAVRWAADARSVESPPAVADGVVFFGDHDGVVYAVDAETGDRRWTYEIDEDAEVSRPEVRTGPTVLDGTVFVTSIDGYVYALDAASGSERWRFEAGGFLGAVGSPAVADGTVYVGSYGGEILHAIDRTDGTERWHLSASDVGGGDGFCSAPTVANGRVYAGANAAGCIAVSAADGTVQWTFSPQTDGVVERFSNSPAVAGDTVFVPSIARGVYAIDAATGEERWRVDSPEFSGAPAVDEGTVYLAGDVNTGGSGTLLARALNRRTGEERWRYETEGTALTGPILVGEAVIVGADDHVVALG